MMATRAGNRDPLLTAEARAALAGPVVRWALAPAAAAWLLLAAASHGPGLRLCAAPRAGAAQAFAAHLSAGLATLDPARWAGEWGLMLAATMLPLAAPMAGYVARRGFAARRERAVLLFLAGYLLVWMVFAVPASALLLAARALAQAGGLAAVSAAIGCGLAAAWQISRRKRRALNRCHGTVPLRAFGAAGDRDAIGFGLLHGTRCVRACAPTMLLPMIGGHQILGMATVFVILLAERAGPAPQFGTSAVLLLMLGAVLLAG